MLTDRRIRSARPGHKPQKLFDGQGLYLLVTPAGSKLWRLKFRFKGREKLLALGSYPATSLKAARERRDDARRDLEAGSDPSQKRKVEKAAERNTFGAVAQAWVDDQRKHKRVAPSTLKNHEARLRRYLLPALRNRPVEELTAAELAPLVESIRGDGKDDTALRVRRLCGQILRHALQQARVGRNVAEDLRGVWKAGPRKNYPSITDPRQVGELMRALDGYTGEPATVAALRLLPLVFVRPGEIRGAEWSEFNLDDATWRIPAHRMKMRLPHLVPLSRQAVALLEALHPITGDGRLVFPGRGSDVRPLSENTLNGALRRLGYTKETMVSHGFRSMAYTLLNEQGWPPDVIDLQLAHQERNKVRAAYNRAQRIEERTRMMQAWADYLDGLKAGGAVVPIRSGGAG